jgi:hypothetical protein
MVVRRISSAADKLNDGLTDVAKIVGTLASFT